MAENFQLQIDDLKTNLFKMASLVDDQANRVFEALEGGNVNLCRIIQSKDLEIDAYNVLIYNQSENILALFQPVASDLRFVIAALMINNHLERCGNLIVNISRRVKKTADHHYLIEESHILEMGRHAINMLNKSIDSAMRLDTALADQVIAGDSIVDKLHKQTFKYLVSKMEGDSLLAEPCSQLIVLSKHVERLADHATNIAENVIFHVDAKNIAHKKKLDKLDRGDLV